MDKVNMEKLDFQKQNGLIPAVIQEEATGEVLMIGYMNDEAYKKTLTEGYVYFWSRGRKKLWLKGEASGNKLRVKKIFIDCDGDALLIKAEPIGRNICHKKKRSCFYKIIFSSINL